MTFISSGIGKFLGKSWKKGLLRTFAHAFGRKKHPLEETTVLPATPWPGGRKCQKPGPGFFFTCLSKLQKK